MTIRVSLYGLKAIRLTEQREQTSVCIAGAGLAGSLLALRLAREGYRVGVYEKRGDPRDAGVIGGRSINLAISTRGLYALEEVGLKDNILDIAIPMPGRMIHSIDGTQAFQPYGTRPDDAIYSVSRGELNLRLIESAAAHDNVEMHFDHRCDDVDLDTGQVTFTAGEGHTVHVRDDFVIGADGAYSRVRGAMQRIHGFDYTQDYLRHGYKELHIPPGADGQHQLDKNALHIWPRKAFMLIALPNIDGSFTCTLFLAYVGQPSFEALRTDEDVTRFFEREFPDATPLMPTLVEDFQSNPSSSLVTIRCGPWHHEDRIVLIGDACHAVVPFYGQGANAAFEDCTVLAQCLSRHGFDHRGDALAEYDALRRKHANVLADLAIENFLEMRDHTGSRMFLLRKQFEKFLARLMPVWFVPLYSMVTFSRTPYGDAVERDRRQWRWVKGVGVAAGLAIVAAVVWLLATMLYAEKAV